MNTVKIKGMSCPHCVASTTKALEAIDGISNVQVNLEQAEATFNGEIDTEIVQKAISQIGFEVISD